MLTYRSSTIYVPRHNKVGPTYIDILTNLEGLEGSAID